MSDQPEIVLNEFGDLSRKARRELLAKGIDPDTAVIEFLNTQSIPIQRPAEVVPEPADVAPEPAATVVESAVAEVVAEAVVDAVEPVPAQRVDFVVEPVSPPVGSTVPTVPWNGATTTAEIFPASMSKREIRSFLGRGKKKKSSVVEPEEAAVVPEEAAVVLEEPAVQDVALEEVALEETIVTSAPVAAVEVEVLAVDPEVTLEPLAPELVEGDIEFAEEAPVEESVVEVVEVVEVVAAVETDSYPAYDEIDGVEDEFDDELDEGPTTISEATAAQALAEAIAAHNAARIDNGLEVDSSAVAAAVLAEDYEQFSVGVSTATGSIPTISNALILPTLPEDTGSIIPIATNTGEIMITESVSIPSSISQLGAHLESLDTSEVDVIANDEDITPTDALAPVSATTAVSSYNLNNAVVTVPRRMSDRLPLVLSLTAAGLAVAVVALFVAGYFLGIF